MGLFGKKTKIPDGIRVVFYEGDLPGFVWDDACQTLLMDDALRITKINPYIEVKLARNRINSIEIFSEQDYMRKYKGNNGVTLKEGEISKGFYVINFTDVDGNRKHIDIWATSFEASKLWK